MDPFGFVFDIEADALYPAVSKIWYLRVTDLQDDSKFLKLYLEESFIIEPDSSSFFGEEGLLKFQEFVEAYPEGFFVVGHNILQYDVWVLWKLWGLQPFIGKGSSDWFMNRKCQFIDTRYLSMFLNPDLPGHSLEDWGQRVGEPKMDYRGKLVEIGVMTGAEPDGFEFSFWNHWMQKYCDQDVKTNKKIFRRMWEKFVELYPEGIPESYKVSQKGFFLMGAQEFTGYSFNKEYALELEIEITEMIEEIAKEIEPKLPPRPLKKGEEKDYTMPAKPFKKDGSLSSHMLNFIEKHNAEFLGEGKIRVFERIEEIESKKLLDMKVPMELKDQSALKDYFLELGWEPVYYNYQKDDKNKFVRDDRGKLIETTPKLQEAGKLDPGLEDLVGDIPKKVVKYLSLRNRLGVLQGWINHPRIALDGRLPARASKITNTHRQAHSTVCNVPKAEEQVLFGKQFRSLFRAEEGFLLAAADAVAGENFTEAHYTLPYPGGEEYVNDLLSGDPHIKNACIFYPDKMRGIDITVPGVKDDPKVKPWRSKSKNGKYALI